MTQMAYFEVGTLDFSLKRRATQGGFTPQDNGLPYRRWPMPVGISSRDDAHATPRCCGGPRIRCARANVSMTIIAAPQSGQTKVG